MHPIFNTYRPEGFSTVNAYLMVEKPLKLIAFLKAAFYAEEIDFALNPATGDVSNCILKIGESCFMVAQAKGSFSAMKTAFYLFVDNVDLMYDSAMANGAISAFEPKDMPYKDRQAGVIDPSGNYWWISKRLEEKGYNE